MRYQDKVAVVAYIAFLAVLVYWVLDQQLLYGSEVAGWAVLVLLLAVHLALGYAVGRAWALPLPLLAVAMALPLGYPSANKGEPLPIWLGLLFFVPGAIALVAIGIGTRRLHDRRRFT
jgi:uncharacterized membrane protein YhaH (DUF805 family)